eukprot:11767007-Karenia_brevis.AAC.1
MDSLDIPTNEGPFNDDQQKEPPVMQDVAGSVVDGVRGSKRHYYMENGVMGADCGILDACGM